MPDLAGHHHVALSVRDLERSARWYAEVLGFEELFREQSEGRLGCVMRFASGGLSVGLVQHGAPEDRFDPVRVGLDHAAFSVASHEELQAWARRFDELGVEHSGTSDIPSGGILNFRDPDGIALALFWDR